MGLRNGDGAVGRPVYTLSMPPDFIALDVETANSDVASICQIGIAIYADGRQIDEWSSLIDPECHFDYWNIRIHQITADDVAQSPCFADVFETLQQLMTNTVCVSHTHFDRSAMNRACERYELPLIETTWLDSVRVARRTWHDIPSGSYNLKSVCNLIGYEFQHHDALEDARAAGEIILAASRETGLDIPGWLQRVEQPVKG